MDNSRQQFLDNIPRVVHVIGCGGVGSWTAITLAMAGVREIWLWDGDDITSHNLNRIPLPLDASGRKADLIRDLIRTLRPDCSVISMGRWTPEMASVIEEEATKTGNGANWLVCTTDTHANRRACYDFADNNGINYIEASAEGEFGGAAATPAEWVTDEETNPGYASVPVWIGPCLQAACAASSYILHNQLPDTGMIFRAGFNGETNRYEVTEK